MASADRYPREQVGQSDPCSPLETLCRPPISDEAFDDISAIIFHDLGKKEWSKRPRLYTVLRMIGRISDMDAFISLGHCDNLFPYTSMSSLPDSLRRSFDLSQAFFNHQKFVYTAACDLEKLEDAKHITIKNGDKLFKANKKRLGEGGAGIVDKVESKMIPGKFYARKRIKRSKDEKGKQIAQFQHELTTMKRLFHQHLVNIEGSYTDSNYLAILMTPVADRNLKEYLLEPLYPEEVPRFRTYYGCLANAIAYLKQNKIRHSDIKPENILLWKSKILITDFGLAYDWSDSKFSNSITKKSLREFTGRYQSPETALGAPRRSSSDVFSLGVVFLEMTTVLKGETLKHMERYLGNHGTGIPIVSLNLEAAVSWFEVIQPSTPRADNIPLQWIKEMINKEPIDRPSAVKLVEQINESTDGTFCASCCKDCDSECELSSTSSEGGYAGQSSDEETFFEAAQDTFDSIKYSPVENIQTSSMKPSHTTSNRVSSSSLFGEIVPGAWPDNNYSQSSHSSISTNATQAKKVPLQVEKKLSNWRSAPFFGSLSSLFNNKSSGPEFAGPCLGENGRSKPAPMAMATASPGVRHLDSVNKLATGNVKRFIERIPEEAAVLADEQPPFNPSTINTRPIESSSSYSSSQPRWEAKEEIRPSFRRNMLQYSKSYDTLQTQQTVNYDITNCLQQSASCNDLYASWDADNEEGRQIWEELANFRLVERTPKPRYIPTSEYLEDSLKEAEALTSNLDVSMGSRLVDIKVEYEHRPIWYATEDAGPIYSELTDFVNDSCNENESAGWTKKEAKEILNRSIVPVQATHNPTDSREKKSKEPPKVVAWLAGKIPSSGAAASTASSNLTVSNLRAANARRNIKQPRLVNASVYMESVLNDAASSVATSTFSTRKLNRSNNPGLSFTRVKDSSLDLLEAHTKVGNPKEVKILLKRGCNPGTKRKPRWRPIFNAVHGATSSHIKCVRKLIEYGVNVNIRHPSSGKTPLHYAIAHKEWSGYSKLIYILLAAGADPNIKDKLGDVPLLQILYGGDKPLEKHRRDALALLLAPNYTTDVNISPKGTMNRPLHLAVLRKDPWAVGMLLEKGVGVNEANGSGLSPLQLAMASWRGGVNEDALEILILLLDKKANVNVKDEITEKTPLHMAVTYALPSHVELLLEHGARADSKDKSGKTPIEICAEQRASNHNSAAISEISTLFDEYA